MTSGAGDTVLSSSNGTGTFAIQGNLNVNNAFSVSRSGDVAATGGVTAAGAVSGGSMYSSNEHNTVGPLSASVISVSPRAISNPSNPSVPVVPAIQPAALPGSETSVYQTLSQQHIKLHNLTGYELWDLSNIKIGSETVPWPGSVKAFSTSAKLDRPSSAASFPNQASGLQSGANQLYARP